MSLLAKLFSPKIYKKYYSEIDDLKEISHLFELYVYHVYEKVQLFVEIKNKYHDLKGKNKGYVLEDQEKFVKKHYIKDLGFVDSEDKFMPLFYTKWINKKLKRLIKIYNLELKNFSENQQNIIHVLSYLKNNFESRFVSEDLLLLEELSKSFEELRKIISVQINEINSLYPLEKWSMELHNNLFTENFEISISKEISLLFNENLREYNFNNYLAIISKHIHELDIPLESKLNYLIKTKLQKIKEKKPEIKSREKLSYVKCFHARPIYNTKPILPLDSKSKEAGFFLDLDIIEAKNIVKSIYHVEDSQIEVFELLIPKSLFKESVVDVNEDSSLKYVDDMVNSYVFKPSSFPKINEFFIKGLIRYHLVTT
ncbi:MAG: hypothetical protein VX028_03755 [Nanoarchaeota archaeon]|nr:hypothetical protein [Nanoarchaeota archaeon]MEC8339234.1 hypothetical protein [Nanoarchaeota archaeon]